MVDVGGKGRGRFSTRLADAGGSLVDERRDRGCLSIDPGADFFKHG